MKPDFIKVQIPVLVSTLDRPAFDGTQLCLLEGLSNALDRQLPGVPQTNETISATSGPKFSILCRHVEEILLLRIFFPVSIRALVAKI